MRSNSILFVLFLFLLTVLGLVMCSRDMRSVNDNENVRESENVNDNENVRESENVNENKNANENENVSESISENVNENGSENENVSESISENVSENESESENVNMSGNDLSLSATEILKRECGSCHQSSLPTAKERALTIFDLDINSWELSTETHQLEGIIRRVDEPEFSAEEVERVHSFLEITIGIKKGGGGH